MQKENAANIVLNMQNLLKIFEYAEDDAVFRSKQE